MGAFIFKFEVLLRNEKAAGHKVTETQSLTDGGTLYRLCNFDILHRRPDGTGERLETVCWKTAVRRAL